MPPAAAGSIRKHRRLEAEQGTAALCPSGLFAKQRTGLGLQDGNYVNGMQIAGIFLSFGRRKQALIGSFGKIIDTFLHCSIGT